MFFNERPVFIKTELRRKYDITRKYINLTKYLYSRCTPTLIFNKVRFVVSVQFFE